MRVLSSMRCRRARRSVGRRKVPGGARPGRPADLRASRDPGGGHDDAHQEQADRRQKRREGGPEHGQASRRRHHLDRHAGRRGDAAHSLLILNRDRQEMRPRLADPAQVPQKALEGRLDVLGHHAAVHQELTANQFAPVAIREGHHDFERPGSWVQVLDARRVACRLSDDLSRRRDEHDFRGLQVEGVQAG